MKKVLVLIVAVSFLLFAVSAFATVANTKHNLTVLGSGTVTTNASATLCGFCHIPHGGNTSEPGLPLWARSMPAGPYQLYSSGGLGKTLSNTTIEQPGTFSKTCLSCHDGTIGLGTVTKNGVSQTYAMTSTLNNGLTANGAFQSTNIEANGYSPYIGTDLQNDHPVGFEFPLAGYGANGGIPGIDITVSLSGTAAAALVGATNSVYPVFQYTAGALTTDVFECATCHDPHLENNGTTQTKFLRGPNASLCQDCHNTK